MRGDGAVIKNYLLHIFYLPGTLVQFSGKAILIMARLVTGE